MLVLWNWKMRGKWMPSPENNRNRWQCKQMTVYVFITCFHYRDVNAARKRQGINLLLVFFSLALLSIAQKGHFHPQVTVFITIALRYSSLVAFFYSFIFSSLRAQLTPHVKLFHKYIGCKLCVCISFRSLSHYLLWCVFFFHSLCDVFFL